MFRITVAPETTQVLFACTATAPAATTMPLPNISPIVQPPVSVPTATQNIPDSVLEDVNSLLGKFTSILRTGDVMPTPTHGVEHRIHTGSHPPVFAKSAAWIQKKRKLEKRKSIVWNPPTLFAI